MQKHPHATPQMSHLRVQRKPRAPPRAKPRPAQASLGPRAQPPQGAALHPGRTSRAQFRGNSVKDRNYHLQFQLPAELIAKVIAIEGSNYQAGPEKRLLPAFGEPPAASWGCRHGGNPILGGTALACVPETRLPKTGPHLPSQKTLPGLKVTSPLAFLPQPRTLDPLLRYTPNTKKQKQWGPRASIWAPAPPLPSPPPRVSAPGRPALGLCLLSEHPSGLWAALATGCHNRPAGTIPAPLASSTQACSAHPAQEAQPSPALGEPSTQHNSGAQKSLWRERKSTGDHRGSRPPLPLPVSSPSCPAAHHSASPNSPTPQKSSPWARPCHTQHGHPLEVGAGARLAKALESGPNAPRERALGWLQVGAPSWAHGPHAWGAAWLRGRGRGPLPGPGSGPGAAPCPAHNSNSGAAWPLSCSKPFTGPHCPQDRVHTELGQPAALPLSFDPRPHPGRGSSFVMAEPGLAGPLKLT